MPDDIFGPDLSGRHVLIPGGTGGVGEGAVRAYLEVGADVVVPTCSQQRADEFRAVLGDAAGDACTWWCTTTRRSRVPRRSPRPWGNGWAASMMSWRRSAAGGPASGCGR
jgi:NAD(P)-dependent dehydrogenase (short-subunit alcohol dehydrogenase family)